MVRQENAWGVSFLRMLDMATDSALFSTREQLEEEGYELRQAGNHFVQGKQAHLPLYEGKMFMHYDHRAASVIRNEENLIRPAQPLRTTPQQHLDPHCSPMPEYWVAETEVRERAPERWRHNWLLLLKDVTSATNERTGIFTVIPLVGAGHKAPLIIPDASAPRCCCLLANLNSLPFDYCICQMIGGGLAYFILKQPPVIRPDGYTDDQASFIARPRPRTHLHGLGH